MRLPFPHSSWLSAASLGFARAFIVLLLSIAASAVLAIGCDPTKQCCAGGQSGGATCDGSGVATQGNTSGTNQGAGNPIDLLSGNKYQREVDLPALPGVLGLEIVRHYNSLASGPDSTLGPLGRGWRLSYETRLLPRGGTLVISEADGSVLTFGRSVQDARRYTGAGATHGYVVVEPAGHAIAWRWYWPSGSRLDFNADGALAQIVAPTGEVLRLSYDDQGWLIKVTDPQGRSLHLVYLDKKLSDGRRFAGVTHIDSPVGRFVYHYGSSAPKGMRLDPKKLLANLVKVDLPTHYDADSKLHQWSNVGHTTSSISRSYHYEDPQHPTLLTGISVSGMGSDGQLTDQRLARYRYDAQGRGVSSQRGDEQVALDFSMPGLTTLTDAHGRRTLYRHQTIAGEPRLTEARGPGCASCSPGNMRYRYDRLGRLTEQTTLDVHGKPVRASRTTRDGYGRVLAVDEVDLLTGKSVRRVRYEYALGDPQAPSDRPVLIARPSVVVGKELQLRIRYNSAGQPVEVRQMGYAPLDGQARLLNPTDPAQAARAQPIERITRYRYQIRNGRSVLAEVDGPLPDGPKASPADSDITRVEYDAHGDYPVTVTQPGGMQTRIMHDANSGRIVQEIDPNGAVSRYRYDTAYLGLPGQTTRAGVTTYYGYDVFGRLSSIRDTETGQGRAVRLGYDPNGQLVSVTDAQGYKQQIKLDSEGLPVTVGWYEPNQNKPLRATYRWYDDNHRLRRQLLPDGRMLAWGYDPQGAANEFLDGDGVLHLKRRFGQAGSVGLDLAPDGGVQLRASSMDPSAADGLLSSADSVADSIKSVVLRTVKDDFNRVLQTQTADHGTVAVHYDAANRPVEVRQLDRDGWLVTRRVIQYDPAGRMAMQTVRDTSGKVLQTIRRYYLGTLLREESDNVQTRSFRYDAAGRLDHTDIAFKDEQGSVRYRTALDTHYDGKSGLADAQTLADGQVMRIARDPATQVVRTITLQSAGLARVYGWLDAYLPQAIAHLLQSLLPAQTVLSDLQFHPYNGITGWTSGNGLVTRRSHDVAGRLTALKVANGADGQAVVDERLHYGVGPRLRSVEQGGVGLSAAGQLRKTSYDYSGFGALKPPRATAAATASPVKDRLGRITDDGQFRYSYTADGQIESVIDRHSGQRLALYRYDAEQHRVSKTVTRNGQSATTWYLWQGDKLVAEIAGSGEHLGDVSAQYLYLNETGKSTPVAKLESAQTDGNGSGSARLLTIHTDQRGAPVAMTDQDRAVVWQAQVDAWGWAVPTVQKASLNLRLPGQYFDAETGLADNWHRSYDARPGSPLRGRYLSPDPLGYPDGPDAYRYASGDPINKIDPSGLYQIDMHYYMVFFLGVAAGIDPEDARTIALASQYVDDNPVTQPVEDGSGIVGMILSMFKNQNPLRYYHFMADTLMVPVSQIHDVVPGNQLCNLRRAAGVATDKLAQQVFYGEFLHALADTYSHADQNDKPYSGVNLLNLGVGHGLDDSDPDYTFNHWGLPAVIDKTMTSLQPDDANSMTIHWDTNASRTLDAERKLYEWLKASPWAQVSKAVSFDQIAISLIAFNTTGESEQYDFSWDLETGKQTRTKHAEVDHGKLDKIDEAFKTKLTILNNALEALGVRGRDLMSDQWGYVKGTGESNRQTALGSLTCADYPGVILPTAVCPMPKNP